jgi:hypothetical protein
MNYDLLKDILEALFLAAFAFTVGWVAGLYARGLMEQLP